MVSARPITKLATGCKMILRCRHYLTGSAPTTETRYTDFIRPYHQNFGSLSCLFMSVQEGAGSQNYRWKHLYQVFSLFCLRSVGFLASAHTYTFVSVLGTRKITFQFISSNQFLRTGSFGRIRSLAIRALRVQQPSFMYLLNFIEDSPLEGNVAVVAQTNGGVLERRRIE